MKNGLAKLSFMMMTAALLTSCQRGSEIKKTAYQSEAHIAVAKMVSRISAPVTALHASAPKMALRGIGPDQFNFWNEAPMQQQIYNPTIDGMMNYCMLLLQAAQSNNTSNQFRLQIGMRCLLYVQTQFNVLSTVAARQLGNDDQYGIGFTSAYGASNQDWNIFTRRYNQQSSIVNTRTQFGNIQYP